MLTQWTFGVSQLNEYVRKSLACDPMLRSIRLQGEVSGFKNQFSSGHWYFTLKDENARISCVLFRQHQSSVPFMPEDGMQVVLTGSVSLYVQGGTYQFYATGLERAGEGDLHRRFEILKNKLLAEGLFDESLKRPLPLLPRKVGIVTSRTGAVIHDICTVAHRRNPSVPLLLCPAIVQGEGAVQSLIEGLRRLSQVADVDVIIIGRGGGSLEDLWAFNEEALVRAIRACPVPVVSAVGHEVDITLSDFAADLRAATPSAAAELVIPTRREMLDAIDALLRQMTQRFEMLLRLRGEQLNAAEKALLAAHPMAKLMDMRLRTGLSVEKMTRQMQKYILTAHSRIDVLTHKLAALGPRQVLSRGYAMVLTEEGALVDGIERLPDDAVVVFADGRADIRVVGKTKGDFYAG